MSSENSSKEYVPVAKEETKTDIIYDSGKIESNRKPSDIEVIRKSSNIEVIKKQSDIKVIRKPSGIDIVRKPSEIIHALRKVTSDLKDIAKSIQVNSEPEDIPLEEASIKLLTEAFQYSHGITEEEAKDRLITWGRNELPEKIIPKWYIFVSQVIFKYI